MKSIIEVCLWQSIAKKIDIRKMRLFSFYLSLQSRQEIQANINIQTMLMTVVLIGYWASVLVSTCYSLL